MPSPSSAASSAASPRAVRLAGGGLALAALVTYANSFSGALIYDDRVTITENASLRDLGSALFPPQLAGTGGRPLANLTFALDHAFGGPALWRYHVTNLFVHVLVALVLFGVVRRTLLRPALVERWGKIALPVALAVAVLWAVHPLPSEVVNYLSQRTESLMALGYLLTLYCFIRGAEGSPRFWHPLAVGACLLGTLCKESIVTAPVLVWLYDRTFVAGTFRTAWQQRRVFYLALAATWGVLAWQMIGLGARGVGYDLGVDWWHYALTECHAVVLYLRLVAWPHPLVVDYGSGVVRDAGAVTLEIFALIAMLAGVGLALRRWPAAGFAGACFFVILAPTSSVVPVVQQPIAENRPYLPCAAVIALAVVGVHRLCGRRARVAGAAMAVLAGGITVQRNLVYRTAVAVWSDASAKCPGNPRAHFNLAVALDARSETATAIKEYREALRLRADYPEAHTNLAKDLVGLGQMPEALDHLAEVVRHNPGQASAQFNFATALSRVGRLAEATAHLEEAIRIAPDWADARNNFGAVLVLTGRIAEAVSQFEKAVQLKPDFAEAHCNLGDVLAQTGRPDLAIAHYETALRIRPNYEAAQQHLEQVRRGR